jgi:hypothetical protein
LAILLPIFLVYQALAVPIEEYAYDTAEFHIYRAVVYSAARADGVLYPRWVQPINAGLGGPFFSLYPPLVYATMDVLHGAGLSHPMAWRLLVALAFVAASVGMFGLGLALLKRADVAIAGAAFFAYNGFLLRDLFERGAPSGMAVALFPAMLWLMLRFAERPSGMRLLLASLCLTAITLLHSQTAFLLIPLAGLLTVFLLVRDGFKRAVFALAPLIAGVLLAAFYMLPFPSEVQQVQFDNALGIDYTNPITNPLRLDDILTLPRSLDTGIDNNATDESPGGLIYAFVLLVGLPVIWNRWRQKRTAEAVLLAGLALLGLAVIWMQLDSATPVWSAFPSLGVFLFRWKLLGILGIITALIVSFALLRARPIVLAGLVVVYVSLQLGLAYPQLFYHYTRFAPAPTIADMQRSALEHHAFGLSSFNEFLPVARIEPLTEMELEKVAASPIETLPAGAAITAQHASTGLLELTISSPAPFAAALHILYFPGWAGYVDGQAQTLQAADATGYILMNVPAGVHTLTLKYEGTLLQHTGEAITLIALSILIALAVTWRGNGRREVDAEVVAPRLHWGILPLLLIAVALKAVWIDPQTTLFRNWSTCAAIDGAEIQTDVLFGERIRLCGLSIDRTEARPGDSLRVTLYWLLEQPATEPADSLVHLLGETFNPETGNPLWGQLDKLEPGDHPLVDWSVGRLYRDRYDLQIPAHTPPGDYQLEIGWWQLANGQRLKPRIARPLTALSISPLDALLYSRIVVR